MTIHESWTNQETRKNLQDLHPMAVRDGDNHVAAFITHWMARPCYLFGQLAEMLGDLNESMVDDDGLRSRALRAMVNAGVSEDDAVASFNRQVLMSELSMIGLSVVVDAMKRRLEMECDNAAG